MAAAPAPSATRSIGIVGAGVMGSGIAQVAAIAGYDTVCVDVDATARERGRDHVTTGRFGLDGAVARGKLTREQADAALARITFSPSLLDAATADIVIEAVPEKLELKAEVFGALDRLAPPATILASNTSGLSIAAIAAATARADRVVGWHWASPAPVMKLAEIVVTEDTSDTTVAAVSAAARQCGTNPVVVKDHPEVWGFVANRVYFAMIREAQRVVEDGIASREDVDRLMMDCFRWPSGPFGMVQGAGSGWSA